MMTRYDRACPHLRADPIVRSWAVLESANQGAAQSASGVLCRVDGLRRASDFWQVGGRLGAAWPTPHPSYRDLPAKSSQFSPIRPTFDSLSVLYSQLLNPSVLVVHGHVLNIRGESYRLRDKRQAGLLTSHLLLNPSPEEPNNTKSQDKVGQY